jgi:hypothetical protein
LAADLWVRKEKIETDLYYNAMENPEDYDRTNVRYIRRRRWRERFVYRRLAVAAGLLIVAALIVFVIMRHVA